MTACGDHPVFVISPTFRFVKNPRCTTENHINFKFSGTGLYEGSPERIFSTILLNPTTGTDKKENKIFLRYKEIQNGSVA
jgi:hypothetical protein